MMEKTEIPEVYRTKEGTFVCERKQSEVNEYLKKRKLMEDKEKEMLQMKTKINNVEAEISEIKDMIRLLLQKAYK